MEWSAGHLCIFHTIYLHYRLVPFHRFGVFSRASVDHVQGTFMKWSAGEVDPDTAIVAADPLCQQALDCQAEDMAIEDTLYALERALTDGHLPSDTYLKQVCSFLSPYLPPPRPPCLHTCLCMAHVSRVHSQPLPSVVTQSYNTVV